MVIHGDEYLTWHWHPRENAASLSLPLMTALEAHALVSSSQGKEVAAGKKKGILSTRHLGCTLHEKNGRTLSILAPTSRADLLISLFSFALRLKYIMLHAVSFT